MANKCNYVNKKGKNKGPCTTIPREGNYCHKHKKYAVEKEDKSVQIEGDPIFETKAAQEPKKPKMRSSVFNYTVNLNKVYEKLSDEEKAKFKKFIEYVFDQKRFFNFVTDRTSPDDSVKNIHEVREDHCFEVGSNNGLLHCHGVISVQHSGYLTLRANDIRAFAKKVFGHAIHFNCPISADAATSWQNYIHKSENKIDM